MPRHSGGWIKVYRSMLDGDIGQNGNCLGLFIRLLAWANLKPSKVRFNGATLELPRGSLLMGVRDIAEKMHCDKNTVLRHMRFLEKRGTLTRKFAMEGSVIEIVNFEEYQGHKEMGGGISDNHADNCAYNYAYGTSPPNEEEKNQRNNTQGVLFGSDAEKHKLPLLAELWNENRPEGLAKVLRIDPKSKRAKDCARAWSTDPNPTAWIDAAKKLGLSSFHMGESATGWKANFDWFIRPGTLVKILESNFENSAVAREPTVDEIVASMRITK